MVFTIKQSDTSPSLQATLQTASGTPVNLNGSVVRLHMKSVDGTLALDKVMTIVNDVGGVVRYNWQPSDTAQAGTFYVEFEVTYADTAVETFPNTGNLVIVITPELN